MFIFPREASWVNNLERRKYAVVILGVLADPRVAVVDVRLIDVLIDNLRHYDEPLGQIVRLFRTPSRHVFSPYVKCQKITLY